MKREKLSKSNILGLVAALVVAVPLLAGCVPGELRAAAPQEEAAISNEDLAAFVDQVYEEPYSLVFNNCIDKTLRIMAEAEKRGVKSDFIGCIAVYRFKRYHNAPIVSPHFYAEIEGGKLDVAFNPAQEKVYCPNSDAEIVMPVNISEMGRAFFRRVCFTGCLLRRG